MAVCDLRRCCTCSGRRRWTSFIFYIIHQSPLCVLQSARFRRIPRGARGACVNKKRFAPVAHTNTSTYIILFRFVAARPSSGLFNGEMRERASGQRRVFHKTRARLNRSICSRREKSCLHAARNNEM